MNRHTRLLRRWRSISFRSGLVAGIAVGIVATGAMFILLSLVFALFVVTGGITQFSVVERAQDQLLLGVMPGDLDLPDPNLLNDNGPPDSDSLSFWAVLQDGEVLQSAGNVDQAVTLAGFSDPGFGVEFSSDGDADGDLTGLKRVDGTEWFYVERHVITPDGADYTVISAADGVFSLSSFIQSSLVGTIPVVLVLMAVAMFVTSRLTRRALRRVEDIRVEVEQISQQSLNRRVPTADAADDIEKLAQTMNDMLGRLESASAQQNQFLADASHELRSPVAGLLAQLDVAAAYPDRVDAGVLLPKLHREAQRLKTLVDDLLFLSRSEVDGAEAAGPPALVDIQTLVTDEIEYQRSVDPDLKPDLGNPELGNTGLGRTARELCVGGSAPAVVRGHSRDLQRAVRNLISNAIRHAEQTVRIDTAISGDEVIISVADDGPGISHEDADRIFDRFIRLDEGRSRDGGGAGLGLAITREIARKHGGSVSLVESEDGGATFCLRLPLAATSRGPAT